MRYTDRENKNLSLLVDSGATWTPRDSNRDWIAVASSADGQNLVAAEYGGLLYTSSNEGATWIPSVPSRTWKSVACSRDGQVRVAAPSDSEGFLYVSNTRAEMSHTTAGIAGHLSGEKAAAVELLYAGDDRLWRLAIRDLC